MDDWQAVTVAVLGILSAVVPWAIQKAKNFKKTGISATLESHTAIYSALNNLVAKTRYQRAVLLTAHNGGAIPTPGKDLYSSVVCEVFSRPFEGIHFSWRKQLLDEGYTQMLFSLVRRKVLRLITSKMDDCILKNLYLSDGVAMSKVIYVHRTRGTFWYLSLNSAHVFSPTKDELNEIRIAVASIAAQLK